MNEEQFAKVISDKARELKELRAQVKIKDEQISGLRHGVTELLRSVEAKDQTILQLKAKKAELSEDVFVAYDERARLLGLISTLYLSIIKVDLDAPNPDYSNVIYILLPTGQQISFHIYKGQLEFLKHVPRMDCHGKFLEPWMSDQARIQKTTDVEWDLHTTEEKWARLAMLIKHNLDGEFEQVLDNERQAWYPIRSITGSTISLGHQEQ